MKRSMLIQMTIVSLILIALAIPGQAFAQESAPDTRPPDLTLSTTYPSQVVELGENVSLKLKLNAAGEPQTVQLEMDELPVGWTATFRGSGRIVHSVYVEADSSEEVDLRLAPPENAEPGTYNFVVLARGERLRAELPVTLTVQEKLPASLSFDTDLPTIKGSPTTTFRYNATIKNDGDEERLINLTADVPSGFLVRFKLSGNEVTSFPLEANMSKPINIELEPLIEVPAGNYPFSIHATGGDLQASLNLAAEVTGQEKLSISGPDGRLSGKAAAGEETTLPILIQNTGSAPAQGVGLSTSAPAGWTVTFNPEVIPEIPAGDQADVTAKLKPADKAVAGDYVVTVRAQPVEGANVSADFRITVSTSTLWGVAGLVLIAAAVGVVALAVMRFGRR